MLHGRTDYGDVTGQLLNCCAIEKYCKQRGAVSERRLRQLSFSRWSEMSTRELLICFLLYCLSVDLIPKQFVVTAWKFFIN